MRKTLFWVLAFCLVSLSFGRVGPVSQYGQLQVGKIPDGRTNAGHGRIFGSCPQYSQTPVQVRGMSLYWSLHSDATEFYNATSIGKMVTDMKIEIIRIPVGTDEYSWSENAPAGFIRDPNGQRALIDAVVQAAVQNDIYVIIDWHSHIANNQVNDAKTFFSEMAQSYGGLDNVIFEIFNEPVCVSGVPDRNGCSNYGGYIGWNAIKNYASEIIPVIRQHSDNLILVGTPMWDQQPNAVVNNAINDANVAYTFHYYANTHHTNAEGDNADYAISRGLSVFVSEWGTGNADGDGTPDATANTSWQQWLNARDLSSANWSASRIDEGTAAFASNSTYDYFSYTTSGNMVKSYLADNPSSYTKCSNTPSSSNSGLSSSTSSEVALIDNFEDGNTTVETIEDSFWFLYTANGGAIFNTEPASAEDPWDMIRSSASNHYASMEGISIGSPASNEYPSVGMGMALAEGSFANCTAIQYDYKGSGHYFRADMSSITPNEGYEHVTENQNKSDSWETVTVSASKLIQPLWVRQNASLSSEVKDFSWNEVYQLVWVFDKSIASAQRATYLQIDNVKCLGTLPEVVAASSSSVASSAASSSPSSAGSSSASVASSTSIASSASITSSAAVASSLIDDFEDGDNMAFTGLNDFWYAFTDKGDNGASTISNSKNEEGDYVVVFGSAAADGSKYGAGLKNIALSKGGNAYDPYVTLGVNLEDGLAGCTQISYKYKGAGHNLKAVTRGDEDGLLSGYNYHKTDFKGSSDWAVASVSVPDGLKQEEGWGTNLGDLEMADIVKLQWEVKKTATHAYLYIDDVKCAGMTIVPFSSSSASVASSASVGPASSNSVQPGESSSSESQMLVQTASASTGLFAMLHGKTLQVRVANPGLVKVQVFDMMGHVMERHSESMSAGSFAHSFESLPMGSYVVRVQQGSAAKTLRMQVR